MNFIKTFIYVSFFLLIGEIILSLDQYYDILNRDKERAIKVSFKETDLKDKIDRNIYEIDSNQKRIMILGDSYIYGGGIKNKDNIFSNYLYRLLKKEYPDLDIEILDLSKPSNNTYNNYNLFKEYYDKFNPEVIIWGYNFNDILNAKDSFYKLNLKSIQNNKNDHKYRNDYKKFIMRIYRSSNLIRFFSSQIQKQLLVVFGYSISIGDFYYLTNNGYFDNNMNWIASMEMMQEIDNSLKDDTKILFYNFPQFNLLTHDHLFRKTNSTIENFINNLNNYYYFDGYKHFSDLESGKFYLSKYDGHPNSLAHEHIANLIFYNF